jgi:hypothetical protein
MPSKAIHAGEDIGAARQKAVQVIEKLRGLRLAKAAEIVEAGVEETLILLRDLLLWRSTGDRVAKSRARGCRPGRAAIIVAPHWRHPCAAYQDHAAAID